MKKDFLLGLLLVLTTITYAQVNWTPAVAKSTDDVIFVKSRMPATHQLFDVEVDAIKTALLPAPKRGTEAAKNKGVVLEFPNREGQFEAFRVVEASIMEPNLAVQFPMIKSYVGMGVDDPTATLYLSFGTDGLHVMVLATDRSPLFIDPYTKDKEKYIVYAKRDLTITEPFHCAVEHVESPGGFGPTIGPQKAITDGQMREYNLVVAATVEYSQFHWERQGFDDMSSDSDKRGAAVSAINTTINRVRGIYERELGVTFVLNANNQNVVFIEEDDGFTNGSLGALLNESTTVIDGIIGINNYDIGHTFAQVGGGVASRGGICVDDTFFDPPLKARAVSGSDSPVGDSYDVDLVAHEMGHHFGANHTYNGINAPMQGFCTTSNPSTAAEPGSGTTIMAYAGICGTLNVQDNSDAYFHVFSLQEINNRLTNGSGYESTSVFLQCSTNTNTGNNEPLANAGNDYTIPKGTAFILNGSATDADSDPITYCWDQIDVDQPNTYPLSSTETMGPLYRSQSPTSSPERYMPMFSTVYGGSLQSTWEVTPTVGRNLNFSLTARDNRADGGQNSSDEMLVTVASAAGPFVVTSQTTDATWSTGESQTITWDVAGTTGNGVNTANVEVAIVDENDAVLSMLAANTPNDGSLNISVPSVVAEDTRIRVKAIGNIFYALNTGVITLNTTTAYCDNNCSSFGSTQDVDGTTYVEFNTITNPSTGESAFTDYTNTISTTVAIGSSYDLTVRVNTAGQFFTEITRVWIDWNRNCDYTDPGEIYELGTAINETDGATSDSPKPIMVPANAALGETQMRVTSAYNSQGFVPNSCSQIFFGEVEDYTLNVVAALPVEFTSFTAKAVGQQYIQLDWQTAIETNNAGFELERSTDGRTFELITWINGSGTSTATQHYQYLDKAVWPQQIYYYRLKQIDYDGTFTYSELRSARLGAEDRPVLVYPNPVTDQVNVVITGAEAPLETTTFELFDALGQRVVNRTLISGSNTISLPYLPAGVYYYRVTDGNNTLDSNRLVVK